MIIFFVQNLPLLYQHFSKIETAIEIKTFKKRFQLNILKSKVQCHDFHKKREKDFKQELIQIIESKY